MPVLESSFFCVCVVGGTEKAETRLFLAAAHNLLLEAENEMRCMHIITCALNVYLPQ